MPQFEAKVSFQGVDERAFDASVSVTDGHLAIDVPGRHVGRWPISELDPEPDGDSVVITAEGEHLVIDVTDPDQLRVSLRVSERSTESLDRTAREIVHPSHTPKPESIGPERRLDAAAGPETRDGAATDGVVSALRSDVENLLTSLASAQTQLRWVQDLLPRRLPIFTRADEAGLGVVQGVSLKERRPLPGSDGLQPWVTVDTGNVYVTDRRLVFSGAQDVEFDFEEIVKKGASPTGLLLGVSSRIQTHILAGPGERLAVVLTAAEKIAKGVDPTLPFREAIARLTGDIERVERRIEAFSDDDPARDQRIDLV